jgi:hypothetical protein
MYGGPPTGGAVKELVDYKRREAKNQGSDHNFVKPDRAVLFRGRGALDHTICHGKPPRFTDVMNTKGLGDCRFDRDQISWGLIGRGRQRREIGLLPIAGFADGRNGLEC